MNCKFLSVVNSRLNLVGISRTNILTRKSLVPTTKSLLMALLLLRHATYYIHIYIKLIYKNTSQIIIIITKVTITITILYSCTYTPFICITYYTYNRCNMYAHNILYYYTLFNNHFINKFNSPDEFVIPIISSGIFSTCPLEEVYSK